MAAMKSTELERTSLPHRLSVSSNTPGSYSSKSHPRSYSQSQTLSAGSYTSSHRISRRKSSSNTAANKEAIVAAITGQTGELGDAFAKRVGKLPTAAQKSGLAFPSSMPATSGFAAVTGAIPKATPEGTPLASLPENERGLSKSKMRRASDAPRMGKEGRKSGAAGDLKCETCGKGYKHSSCLTKHLWEHTPEWQLTSKLLISKHQQVQLLEAASVLVAMNQESSAMESDSSSPAASGSSDVNDSEMSSIEATPPPQERISSSVPRSADAYAKRFSDESSSYSQSYQSSVFSESLQPSRSYVSHQRQWSVEGRPTTSGTSISGSYKEDRERAELAAAVELLSCSFGTPKSGPSQATTDVPPVPPLPMQFLGQSVDHLSGSTVTMSGPRQSYSYLRGRKDADVDMEDDEDSRSDSAEVHAPSTYEGEEGMFGRMEE